MSTCLNCGCFFIQSEGVGRKKKHCSDKCRREYSQKIKENAVTDKNCEVCGKPLNRVQKQFCSQVCCKKVNLKPPRAVYKKVCLVCGNEFESCDRNQSCCSKKCGIEILLITQIKKICTWCGKEFSGQLINHNQKYCSISCRWKAENKTKTDNGSKLKRSAVYRGKLQGQSIRSTRISPLFIYERDNWICRICNAPIDKALNYPHPLSKSLDHIIPLSKGGDHTEINLQSAHLVCNLSKGAKYQDSSENILCLDHLQNQRL